MDKTLLEHSLSLVDHLDDTAWLSANLGALGRRHAGMGVTEAMYGAVAECMIAAMAEIGGERWTTEMTEGWGEALTAVASLMLAGYPAENEAASGAA